jgi:Domain of unknown function (DUF4136)
MLKKLTLSALAAASLAGCASSIPPVQVTRFHANPQLAAGAAVIEPANGGDAQSLEFRAYAAAVSRELTTLGVTEAQGTASPYVVTLDIGRETREELSRGSPVTIGVGGGSFGSRSGVGFGTSFGLGRNRGREVIITRMAVQIRKRADKSVIWEGRAETEASSRAPASQPGLAADKLAAALFKGFPGTSGQTVRVP